MTAQPTRDQLRALADAATPGPWETYMVPPERNRAAYVAVEAGDTEIRIARYEGGHFDGAFIAAAREAVPELLDQLAAAEKRATRAKAQSTIRGRAVTIYQRRAREAEAEARTQRHRADDMEDNALRTQTNLRAAEERADEWRQTALDERGRLLDALEQIKARGARIKAVQDVLDQAEASINHHPAYTFSGQRMDPIVNGADIRRALLITAPAWIAGHRIHRRVARSNTSAPNR